MSRRRPLVGQSPPARSLTRLCSSSDFQEPLRVPQNTSRVSDTRKGPPPFIDFEQHLSATNMDFAIPALNLSLNSPPSTVPERPAPETPVPSAPKQLALANMPRCLAPSTIPSPIPTLVGEPDIPTGLRDVPLTHCSGAGTTRIS